MTAALFGHVLATEARKRLTYRADFWFGAVLGLAAHFAVAYFVAEALFAESGRALVGGYTRGGLLVYYLLVVLFGKIVASIELEQSIGQDIYEGGLTRYLVYPAPYPLFKYAQQLGALTPIVVQIALVGLLAPLFLRLEAFPLTADTVARGLASLALANLLYFVFTWPLQAVAFWADNVWSLIIAWRFGAWLLGGMMVPLSLFPESVQGILHALPFRYLYSFPVETFLGRIGWGEWIQGTGIALAWGAGVAALSALQWRRGGLRYTGVGI